MCDVKNLPPLPPPRLVCLPWEAMDQTERGWLYVLALPDEDPVQAPCVLKVTWHA